jgi:predicted DNA-binding transcriptional regulator YafY
MLARPSIRALYSADDNAASQSLRRDLILLTGASERQHRQQARGTASTPGSPGAHPPLVRYTPATERYALTYATGPLRFSPEALEALCMLANALHGGQRLPWGTALFSQLRDALAPDQQAQLEAALQGQPYHPAAPTITLDLPDVEEQDLAALRLLMRAIRQRQTISFDYQRRHLNASTAHRGDEVLEVWFDSHIYIDVWCDAAQHVLHLRLDRMVPGSLRIYPRTATPRQRRGERIRYWLSPEIAQGGVSVRLEAQEVRHQADGSAIVSGIARSRFWARRLLLSYGSNARALHPPTLVEEMRHITQEMAQIYQDAEKDWEADSPLGKGRVL